MADTAAEGENSNLIVIRTGQIDHYRQRRHGGFALLGGAVAGDNGGEGL
jgi:hypothetical protein